jgi:putative Holliday junction resolvase
MFLGIDYGSKRIGLAIGSMIPKPLKTIVVKDANSAIFEICQICQENEVEKIVVGMPIRSGGEEGTTAPEIKDFAKKLGEKCKIEIVFEPEQYSSAEAEEFIKRYNLPRDKELIDSIAACIILEQYINSL